MDFNHAARFSRVAGALLALGFTAPRAVADDSSSMSFITASDTVIEASPSLDASGASSELVVFADDSEPAFASDVVRTPDSAVATPAAPAPSAQAALTVIANSGRKAPLTAIIPDAQVVPAAHRRGPVFNGQARRPGGAQTVMRQHVNNQPITIASDIASDRQAPLASRPTQKAATPQAGSTADGALLRAYELSLSAQTEAEYSQIIADCAAALRAGMDGENRKFGFELSAWALNRRGQTRAEQDQLDLALADFRAALEFDPNCWRAYHNRGVSLAQAGHFAEAFDDICRVITINPNFAKAYSNRATLYVQAGDVDRAIADYESALRLEPGLVQAMVGHGRLCHALGQYEDALANFDQALEQGGATAEIACSRGDLLVDLGRYREALEGYAQAIDIDPKFEHAYRNGAWLLATCPDDSIRDVNGALAGAQKALQCGYGDRHSALDTLAAALANAGRYSEAVDAITQAMEIAPAEARSAYEERRAMYQSGQPFRTEPVSEIQTADFIEG